MTKDSSRSGGEIPAGMVAWHGGDSAPADWNGGSVLTRGGRTWDGQCRWWHIGGESDIIAYTPRTPEPAAVEARERDPYEVANQLAGYVGPNTDPPLASFLLRESEHAMRLADRLAALTASGQGGGSRRETCSCMEIAGEDPDCIRHGTGTIWAKEHPDICELAERFATLPATDPVGREAKQRQGGDVEAIALADDYAAKGDWNGAYHAMRIAYADLRQSVASSTGERERLTRDQYPEIIQAVRWMDEDGGTPDFEPGIGFIVDDPEGMEVPHRWLPHLDAIEAALAGLDHEKPHPLDVDTLEYLQREGKEPALFDSAVRCFVTGEHTPVMAMAHSSEALWTANRFFNERFEGWEFDPAAGFSDLALRPDEAARRAALEDALELAVRHLEHLSRWVGDKQMTGKISGYSFEALGEDMPGIYAALETQPTAERPA